MPLRLASLVQPDSAALKALNELVGRKLAGHLGRSFVPVGYPNTEQLVRGVPRHDWDVACLPLDGDRPTMLEFTSPYLQVESGYLVPATGPIRSIEDADRPGVCIAVAEEGPVANRLASLLRHAHLLRVASERVAMRHLNRGDVEVVAGLRLDLLRLAEENDGYWVLIDTVFELPYALAIASDDRGLLNEATAFVGRLTVCGLISKAIASQQLAGVHSPEIRTTMSAEWVASRRGGS